MEFREMTERLAAHRKLKLLGELDEERQRTLCSAIELLGLEATSRIDLLIDSEGGDVRYSKRLADAIRFSAAPVRGIVTGEACSGAFRVLQACHARAAYPNAQLMFHHGHVEIYLDRISDPLGFLTSALEESRQFLKEIATKSGKRYQIVQEWARKAKRFSAKEALELHFIDEILEPPTR